MVVVMRPTDVVDSARPPAGTLLAETELFQLLGGSPGGRVFPSKSVGGVIQNYELLFTSF